MTRLIRASAFAAAFAISAAVPAFADVSTNPQSAPKGSYNLLPAHSLVGFCIRHQNVSNYCGWFKKTTGKLRFSGGQPENSSGEFTIDVASVDTRSDELDSRLKDDFFEVSKFPTATFKTTSIKVTGKNQGEITGDLTLHGVTKPVTLKAVFNGGQQHPIDSGYQLGFSADATIKKSDFAFPNVAWNIFVGDDVTLHIETEFLADQ